MKSCEKMYQDDPEAFFDWIYETYKRFVFKEAGKYFDNPSDIEDLTQEVWLSISRKGEQLSTYSSAQQFSYLAAAIRNKAISLMRKHKETLPLEFASNITYEESDTILDLIDRKIAIDEFHRLWLNVPAAERELLERKYFLLETDTEIASTMGIQKNSVRMALSRARKIAFAFLKDMADYL